METLSIPFHSIEELIESLTHVWQLVSIDEFEDLSRIGLNP